MQTEDMKFSVLIDKAYKMDLGKDLEINRADINTELSNQPAMFAWYATIAELAKAKTQQLKTDLELLEAELDQKLRRQWDADANGKMTEASLQAAIKMTPAFQKAQAAYHEAVKNQGMLQVAKIAFEQRKDMLISLASNMRAEGDTQLSVNKQTVAEKLKGLRKAKAEQ